VRCKPVAVVALILLIGSACGNATKSSGGGGVAGGGGGAETQGISNTEIRVGSLASITGPLGNQYAPIADGVEAYLGMINDHGGVNGRKIVLSQKLDDATNPSRDISQARALNEQYKDFAVVGVAVPIFTGLAGPFSASGSRSWPATCRSTASSPPGSGRRFPSSCWSWSSWSHRPSGGEMQWPTRWLASTHHLPPWRPPFATPAWSG
jgi:hypothetical protein